MPIEEPLPPKLLLVVGAAFGELFNAMYLVTGGGFRVVFALRGAAFELNRNGLPGNCYRYESVAELYTVIDEEKPDLVCLFSGYLLVDEKAMNFAELDRFIDNLLSRGLRVVTSDPFLGLPSRIPFLNPANPFELMLSLPVKLLGGVLFGPSFDYFSAMPSLRRVPHLYVVDPDEPGEVKRLAFYNPNFPHFAAHLNGRNGQRSSAGADPPAAPHWMFILGGAEYALQTKRFGISVFQDLLKRKLRDTLEAGRRPVLFASKELIDLLSMDASLTGCEFLQTCSYEQYVTLLLEAEYVFYWNIFSASILARLINSRPTFFFGTGHLADADGMMFEKGMRRYYAQATLGYLDQTHVLSESALAGLAARQEQELFQPVLRNLRPLPAPSVIVRQLLS